MAAAEWAFAGRVGLELDLGDDPAVLFGEGSGRYLLEVAPADAEQLQRLVPSAVKVGTSTSEPVVRVGAVLLTLEQVEAAYVRGEA